MDAKTAEKIEALNRQHRATQDPIERDRISEVICDLYEQVDTPVQSAPATSSQCECERGPIVAKLTLTNADGILLDRAELCQECVTEKARALYTLDLSTNGIDDVKGGFHGR